MPNGNCCGVSGFELSFEFKPVIDLGEMTEVSGFDGEGGVLEDSSVPCMICGCRITSGITAVINNGCRDKMKVGAYCREHDDGELIMQTIVRRATTQFLGRADELSRIDINTIPVNVLYSGIQIAVAA